jgi:hypothetical protein
MTRVADSDATETLAGLVLTALASDVDVWNFRMMVRENSDSIREGTLSPLLCC